ncbi:hypothetical protein TRVL_04297 [Trypanosoma vivax]|nr:hypothetical protein TRVL_04297 [Trypanosoma vivax]
MHLLMNSTDCAFARAIGLITQCELLSSKKEFPMALTTLRTRLAGRLPQQKACNAHIARAARKSSRDNLRRWYLTVKECNRGDVQHFLARSECHGRLNAVKHETRQ